MSDVSPQPVVICPSCGQENPAGSRFCNACGAPLAEAEIDRSDELSHQADFRVTLAEVLRLAGRTDESISLLEQALERYEQKGNRVSADATRALLDENAG
jgi:predicted amidophosphoribosyltransferase